MPFITAHAPGSATPRVSVVVPSYNPGPAIEHCLDAVCRQKGDVDYEVLVVDSSADGTDALVRERFPGVRLIHLENRTLPGMARNLGAHHARGEIILFIDADCVAPPEWISRHRERHPEWDVVGGVLGNGTPASPIGWASYLSEFGAFTPGDRLIQSRNLVSANVSYDCRVFDVAQFPVDLFPGEDRLFHWRLGERFRCCLDGAIVVDHLNRTSLKEFLLHQERLGSVSARIRRRADLPGAHLLKRPWLAFVTPLYRGLVLAWRLLRQTPWMLVPFLLVYPLILLGSCYWARAFVREVQAGAVNADSRVADRGAE